MRATPKGKRKEELALRAAERKEKQRKGGPESFRKRSKRKERREKLALRAGKTQTIKKDNHNLNGWT